jgi:hypothetical protein
VSTLRKPRYSWKRAPGQGIRDSRDLHLRLGGVRVATVSQTGTGRWYFYGFGSNSLASGMTLATEDEAKLTCLEFAKASADALFCTPKQPPAVPAPMIPPTLTAGEARCE